MSTKKFSIFGSLKSKIAGLMVGMSLMLGIASWGVLKYIVSHQEKSQLQSFEAFSRVLSDAIAAQFFERYGDIQAFAINPAIQSPKRETIVEALNALGALYGIYDLTMVVDANGRLVAVNSKTPTGADLASAPLYKNNYSNAPWFKAVMAGKTTDDKEKNFAGTFVEEVNQDPWIGEAYGGNHLATSFSAPVKDSSGKVIGVITNRAGSRWFEVAFKEVFAGLVKSGYKTGQTVLVSQDGTLLYEYSSSNPEKLDDSKYNWDQLLKLNLAGAGNVAAKALLERKSGATRALNTQTGEHQIAGYTPVTGGKWIDALGWGVIVRVSEGEALATIRQVTNTFYLVLTLALLIACGVGYIFSSILSNRLIHLTSTLTNGSNDVAMAAVSISGSANELSGAAIKQAAAIQETAASIDEVSSMAKKAADNSTQSQKASQISRETAEGGQKAVQEMIQSIDEINQSNNRIMTQVEEGNRQISDIAKVISEIGAKTKVINDIVFQTKLLSFNASVEAARAGEHGKGFAVVAEEVGKLAQMSGNAAKDISNMLQSSIQRVESIVTEIEGRVAKLIAEGREKVELGTRTAQACGDALGNILTSVQEVDTMVSEISSASQEQAIGVTEVNKAINQLDQFTQTNSAAAQNSAAMAEQLTAESQNLKNVVNELNALITGVPGSVASTPAPVASHKKPAKVLAFAKTPTEAPRAVDREIPKPRAAVGSSSAVASADSIPGMNDPRFKDV